MDVKKTVKKPVKKIAPKATAKPKPVQKKPEPVNFERLKIRELRRLAKKKGVRRWNTRTRRGLYTALRAKGL